jgi:hypothetical protein
MKALSASFVRSARAFIAAKRTCKVTTLVMSLSLWAASGRAHADDLAWLVEKPVREANGNTGLMGTEFTPAVDVYVTALGYYDDTFVSPDGLAAPHKVGVFVLETQELVAFAAVPAGTTTTKRNHFRFVPVSPTRLSAETTYVIAAVADGDEGHNVTAGSSLTVDPAIAIGGWRVGSYSTFSFPDNVLPTSTNFMGATFEFSLTPPPPAEEPAWYLVPGSYANSNTGVFGTGFTPQTDISVTALGWFDDTYVSEDGLAAAHQVGIFEIATEDLIVSATVPAGTETLKIDHFRFVPIAPTELSAGTAYVVAGVATVDFGRNVTPGDSMIVNQAITLGARRARYSYEFGFPDVISTAETRYMGPSFLFEVIDPNRDTDGDGVADPQDECPDTIAGVEVDEVGCPPPIPGDLDRDGDVDLDDFAVFQGCLGGTGTPADPNCAGRAE